MAPKCPLNWVQTHCGTHGPPAYLSCFIGGWYHIRVELNDREGRAVLSVKSTSSVIYVGAFHIIFLGRMRVEKSSVI